MSQDLKVICFLFDPNVGGPTIRARAVSKQLRLHGFQVVFALPTTRGTAKGFLAKEGFKVVDLGIEKPVMPRKLGAFLRFAVMSPVSLWKLVHYLRREKPDVIHVNGAFDLIPAVAGRLAGVAVVWHLNDTVFGTRLSNALGFLVHKVADIVAISSERVAVHYNIGHVAPIILRVPVDMSYYPATTRQTSDTPYLGLVGNWNPLKGQAQFIRVVSALRGKGIDVRGQVFGKLLDSQVAYWKPILASIKSEGLSDVIEVAGFVEDIHNALANIDILLVTSVSESGPMSCIEAMAAGIPVVSFDVGDVGNMLDPAGDDQCGFVVPIGDTKAMAAYCERLLNDAELYARMTQNGHRRAARLYSVAASAKATSTAYELAISRRKTG